MAIKYYERYPQRWDSPSQDYPQGAFKNLSALGEQDGSYLEKDWLNDKSGFFGALLRNAEMTPNGLVDTAQKSQFYEALLVCARKAVDLGDYYTKAQVDGKIVEEWGDRTDATLSQKFISLNLNYISPDLVNKSLKDTLKLNRYVDLQDKTYNVNDFIKITDTTLNVSGGNIVRDATTNPSFLVIENSDNALIRDLSVDNISASSSTVGHNFSFVDSNLFAIKNIKIKGFAGTGSGAIAYTTSGIGTGGTILNSSFEGNPESSLNTNGFLIVGYENSLMSGLVAKGVKSYAIEYKNKQRDSIISDSIAENSGSGFVFGQTLAEGEVAVNHTVSNNVISKNCGHGWLIGKAQYNVISNAVIYNDENHNFSSKVGVRLVTDSNYNSICNLSISGDMQEPVRIDDSSYNYVSLSPHNSGAGGAVTITGSSVGNVVDIQSPSDRTTILSSIHDTTGNPISGENSNPVFCHATGEYRGSLSGRWRWIHDVSSRGISSSLHKWVFESKGDAYLAMLSDGTGAQGIAISDGTYNPSFRYWWNEGYWDIALKDPNTGYKFYSNTFRTDDDDVKSLGTASRRWTQLYATTGTINTSDERLKDQVRDLSDTERLVALELKGSIKAFKWKDAIDKKGTGARIHIGVMAQTVVAIFEKYGLDAHDYALLCHDEWTDEETSEKRDQYGVRYDQLLAFIIGSL